MATTSLTSVEDYLQTEYEPDAEFVDGAVEERPMGEYDHAIWQKAILKWFMLREDAWNIEVLPELRVQVRATCFRVPDVVVLDRSRPVEQALTHPPIAVFEILSPENRMTRMLVKLQDYAQMGVASIWLADPKTSKVYRYQERSLQELDPPACVTSGDRLEIDWPAILASLVS